MAKKELLADFIKKFGNLSTAVERRALNDWQNNTLDTLRLAQDKAPVAAGILQKSGAYRRAKITNSGISSAVAFRVPYAEKLNDVNGNFELKNPGELSYTTGDGTRVMKRKKGEKGFLDKAVKEMMPIFLKELGDAIGTSFDRDT